MRSEELTVPGRSTTCARRSTRSPSGSPAFREIAATGGLAEHGLEWIYSDVPLAHPLDGGRAAVLHRSVDDTAIGLGEDASPYRRLFGPLVKAGFGLTDGLMSPFTIPPKHPLTMVRYGAVGLLPAHTVARRAFDTDEAQALFAGLAGHSILSLKAPVTAGYGLMLGVLAHLVGWPLARGGSQQIADALVAVLEGLGGRVECDHRVDSLAELPPNDAVLLDVTPRQVIALAGESLPNRYAKTLDEVPVRAGCLQGRLGARWSDPVDERRLRPRGHRAPRWDARRDHRGRRRRSSRSAARAALCAARAAELVRPEPGARRYADRVGVLSRPERFDGRHDRRASRRRSNASPPASVTASSDATR